MRTPKERTSTSTGVETMFSIIRRGTIILGFGQGLPSESGMCSQGRQVARGTASRLKNMSGSFECMAMRSYIGSQP